ncbi:MAG: mannose-1-phosphate guanylyltransferase [Janthinobacterium lividum]
MTQTSSELTIAVVIPAGGGGTRLWPRSRQETPKQFLDIVSERTMLQETTDRVEDLVPPERLYVITNARHAGSVREQLSEVPAGNIVGEPEGRDSAPAIGLMAAILEKTLGLDAIMATLPADHVILNNAQFCKILEAAAEVASEGYLVTLGIPPTGPDIGFGYIQSGETIRSETSAGVPVYLVKQFREKPQREVAEQYLRDGGYFWNAGMFIASVRTLRELYKTHLPQMEAPFAQILATHGTDQFEQTMRDVFPTLEKISVDYGIAEKADKVAVIPADIGWNDVGSWQRLAEILSSEGKESENIVIGHHVGVDTHGSMIYSPDRLIATIGMEDIIVIDTPDAILICPKSRSEEVKKIVDELKARGLHDLL